MTLQRANRNQVAALLVAGGAVVVAVALPAMRNIPFAFVMAVLGAALLVWLSFKLRHGVPWARDILLIAFIMLTALALLTLLSGLSFIWVLVTLVSAYIGWSLLAL